MRHPSSLSLLTAALCAALALALPACGDTEQPPTGGAGGSSTTSSSGGAGGTGGHHHTGGSTTTTGGGGSTSSSGGTGGSAECEVAGDCGISDACHSFTCEAGACSESFAAQGIQAGSQQLGDCQKNVCDGAGAIVPVNDDQDPFDDQNDCTEDTCLDGAPQNGALPEGTACASNGGAFCDGAKACVECIAAGDCASGVCAADHTCAPAECGDGTLNGSETDTDCGGPVCGKCPVGDTCDSGADCIEGVCDPVGKTCTAPSCSDGVTNGDESDQDCGGATCLGCQTGDSCTGAADCKNGVCSGNPLTCQMATCSDNVKNGQETDKDCGGPMCVDCIDGKVCNVPADCVSGVCSGTPTKTCQIPSCSDNTKNGGETGTDCGGPMCNDCMNGQGCAMNADCVSGFCNMQNVCATPTCNDGAKNGNETGTDCGGPTCADCPVGQGCGGDGDCQSGFCFGSPLTCQADINGCTMADFQDLTGQSLVTVNFGSFFYTPKCIKISAGSSVKWAGAFSSHPLQGGAVVNFMTFPDNSQIPQTATGSEVSVTFQAPGVFPYYCGFHVSSMQGAVMVAP